MSSATQRRVCGSLAVVLVGIIALPQQGRAATVSLTAADRARANVVATEAIYQYRDKRYLDAAKSFVRAYQLTKKTMPRMLRNAAKAYEAAGRQGRALATWEQIERPLGQTDLSRKEAALLRKEARIHVRDLRLVMGQQKFEWAEQFYAGRKYRRAGDAYIDAYTACARQTPSYLRFAARAYQKGGLMDEALIGWARYGAAKSVGTIGQEEATRQQTLLQREVDALLRNKQATKHYRAGRFNAAAKAFLAAHDKSPAKRLPQLRMAAMSLERAKEFSQARELWRRYAGARRVTRLGRQEAEDRLRAIDIRLLTRDATRLFDDKKFQAAGDKWVEVYAMSRDKDAIYLRKAAMVYERAKAYTRAQTMWIRYSTAPTVSDDEQEGAHARARQLEAANKSGGAPPPPPVAGLNIAGLERFGLSSVRSCDGCKLTALIGAAVAISGMGMWAMAEDQSMKLASTLAVTDSQGRVWGTDPETAAKDEDIINTNRNIGFTMMGLGAVAMTVGVISDLVRSGPATADSGPQLKLNVAGRGLVFAWQGAL